MTRAKTFFILPLSAALALSACAIPEDDPYRNTKAGAAVGGLLGAVAGMATNKNNKKGAIKGAILGAGAGGLIGTVLDQQERALRGSMSDNVMIQNTGDRLIVTLPHDILFDTDSTALRPAMRSDLAALAQNLQDYPNSNVQVVGHTDNVGDAIYNDGLSLRRANAVAGVLTTNGVAPGRILTTGRGEAQPVASNLTEEGRRQNRRVEIVILPNA